MSANSKQVSVRSASGTVALPSEKTNRIKSLKKPLEEEEFTEVSKQLSLLSMVHSLYKRIILPPPPPPPGSIDHHSPRFLP